MSGCQCQILHPVSHHWTGKKLLARGLPTLQTAYEVGLSGTGRLHDLFTKSESMSPGQYRSKGKDISIVYDFYLSTFGEMLMAETNRGICHLHFVRNRVRALADLKRTWENADLMEGKGRHAELVQNFLNRRIMPPDRIPLHVKGSDFQIKVWEALLTIPEGQLVSYEKIAQRIGKPRANRAVGTAIGKNSITYLIPCHRVIRNTGAIGQYRWGNDKKLALIGWETVRRGKE